MDQSPKEREPFLLLGKEPKTHDDGPQKNDRGESEDSLGEPAGIVIKDGVRKFVTGGDRGKPSDKSQQER